MLNGQPSGCASVDLAQVSSLSLIFALISSARASVGSAEIEAADSEEVVSVVESAVRYFDVTGFTVYEPGYTLKV